jgi:hypothetical protein
MYAAIKNLMNKMLFLKNKNHLFLVFGILAIGLFLLFADFPYNQVREAEAQDIQPLICKKQTEINLPAGISFELGPNDLEAPLGEAVDRAEMAAEEIIAQIDTIIMASEEQVAAARNETSLVNQCNADNCTSGCETLIRDDCFYTYNERWEPYPCPTTLDPNKICYEKKWDTGYYKSILPCEGGPVCPYGKIESQRKKVKEMADRIAAAYAAIADLFENKKHLPYGRWWWQICNAIGTIPGCPQPPVYCDGKDSRCRTEIELILDKLGRLKDPYDPKLGARGRLKECAAANPEAVLKGEERGKFLFSCSQLLEMGAIDKCYGNVECLYERDEKGKSEEELHQELMCPRMENFYCCE